MKKEPGTGHIPTDKLTLQLYVSGMSQKSMEAIENIKHLCDACLETNAYDLEIIDLYKNPAIAFQQHIVFSPMLVKVLPLPRKKLIGTLSDTDKVMRALGITMKE